MVIWINVPVFSKWIPQLVCDLRSQWQRRELSFKINLIQLSYTFSSFVTTDIGLPTHFALANSLKLLSPNYCCLWPWEGSWLTHWVLSNGFDPLLWPQPSVTVGIVMREKRPLVSPTIPSLQPLCMCMQLRTVIWYQPFIRSTSQPCLCSCLHNLADDENRIKG